MTNDWTKVNSNYYERQMCEFLLVVYKPGKTRLWIACVNEHDVGKYRDVESAMHGAEKYAALSSKE